MGAERSVCSASGHQLINFVITDGSGGFYAAWPDNRAGSPQAPDIYAQRVVLDTPVPTRLALVSSEVIGDVARLVWEGALDATRTVDVERGEPSSGWHRVAVVEPDGRGRIVFEDRHVVPGDRFGYRLVDGQDGSRPLTGETWLMIPAPSRLALTSLPNPSSGQWATVVSLPAPGAATLELFDLAGRVLRTVSLRLVAAGDTRADLGSTLDLPPGVYSLRLTQAGRSVTARVCVAR